MIKSMYFGNVEFKDKLSFLKALKDNEERIIDIKKSVIHKSIDKGQGIEYFNIEPKSTSEKGLSFAKDKYIYPIINSTQWLDSHDDVHLKGCYKRTVNNQQGKVYFVDAHGKSAQSIITAKSQVTMFFDEVDWRILGKDIDGSTECLIFEIEKLNVKPYALDLLEKETGIECSLAMIYKDIFMAVNSDDKYFTKNKELWDANIDQIANKEQAIERGFFFGVKELQIMGEGSICPITGGSNSATAVYLNKFDSLNSTQNTDPSQDTQTKKQNVFIKI
jgi:hypothetical protein